MLTRFQQFISQNHLFSLDDHLLLAVSGGIDSVVLCHLVNSGGFRFSIAHCNFHLRPDDCYRDELFVRSLADSYGVPCFVASFATAEESRKLGMSVEETARCQRYSFFEQLLQQEQYSCVCTGHHRDDATETFFLNLLRGTGIAGLHGIRPRNGNVVRPLLPFGREEIEAYATANALTHVEDYTNASVAFRRNRIRHELMPLLRAMSPAIDKTMQQTIAHLSDAEQIYRQRIDAESEALWAMPLTKAAQLPTLSLSIAAIDTLNPQRTLLFELLRPFGFSASDIDSLLLVLHRESGRIFLSSTHYMVKDRETVVITCRNAEDIEPQLDYQELPASSVENLKTDRTVALFDADSVDKPLHLRHWRKGDKFYPFAGKGGRLLSDFFSDNKLSLIEKDRVWLLCDRQDRILWVVGIRSDNRFRVTTNTQCILKVSIKSPSS